MKIFIYFSVYFNLSSVKTRVKILSLVRHDSNLVPEKVREFSKRCQQTKERIAVFEKLKIIKKKKKFNLQN